MDAFAFWRVKPTSYISYIDMDKISVGKSIWVDQKGTSIPISGKVFDLKSPIIEMITTNSICLISKEVVVNQNDYRPR